MKFKYTILYVESVSKTLSFYEKSFGFKTKFLHEAGDYGELDTGDTILAFSSLKLMSDLGENPEKSNPAAPIFEIAFETEDVRKELSQAIKFGVFPVFASPAKQEPCKRNGSNQKRTSYCTTLRRPL